KEIQEWAAAKAMLGSERNRVNKSSLDKLQHSPLAQSIMGVLMPYLYPPKSEESQN
ncbi:unnamed protein product, partial [marine sediment metagenome]